MELLSKKVNGENLQQILFKIKKYLDDEITGANVDEWYDGTILVGDDISKYGVVTEFPHYIYPVTSFDSIEVIKEGE